MQRTRWFVLAFTVLCTVADLAEPTPLAGQSQDRSSLEFDPTWQVADDSYASQAYRLSSRVLGEERRLFVALPPSHGRTSRDYPVVIVLDGESIFATVVAAMSALGRAGHAPEAIIVGVENTDRLRDLSPPGLLVSGNAGSGRADRFMDFLEQEMLPTLRERVRAGGPVYLVGHSSGGLFVHYAAAARPEVFGSILSMDAPMHLEGASAPLSELAERSSGPLRLVSLETRFGWPDDVWDSLVRIAPDGWTLVREEVVHETHQTMVWPGSYRGLKHLFGDFSSVASTATSSLDLLRAFDERAPGNGRIPPSESLLRQAVEDLIIGRYLDEATGTLDRMVEAYGPNRMVDDLRSQIEEASPEDLDGPPVAELLAAPRPSAEAVDELVGRWQGYMDTEGSGRRQPVDLTIRIEGGVPEGELAAGQGPPRALEYIGIDGSEVHVGYMNGVRPRGLLMYEGIIQGDVFEGYFVLRGVVFTLPGGRELPITRFRLERVPGG